MVTLLLLKTTSAKMKQVSPYLGRCFYSIKAYGEGRWTAGKHEQLFRFLGDFWLMAVPSKEHSGNFIIKTNKEL